MAFEQMLREKIAQAPFRSPEKEVLKVVLGEWQLKTAQQKPSDEMGYNLIKKMISGNDENLKYLGQEDARRTQYLLENRTLQALLPNYLTVEEIEGLLAAVDVTTPASENQAMGVAMKHLKATNALVESETVKKTVAKLRAACPAKSS